MLQDVSQPENLDAQKKVARKQASTRRKQAQAKAGSSAPNSFTSALINSGAFSPGAIVSGFLPIGSEIDPRPAMELLRDRGHQICLPCVVGADRPLVFRLWAPDDPLVVESFGTRAPDSSAQVVKPDALLVPLLAFDASGFRLGYGGGFYDRSLEQLRREKSVTAIGIAFSGQKTETVPRAAHDQPLDWIVTEVGATCIKD